VPECRAKLPKAREGEEPLPEGLLWLLLTGEVPTAEQAFSLSQELHQRSKSMPLPPHLIKILADCRHLHPMTLLSIGVTIMQEQSVFSKEYQKGIRKDIYWEPIYEDVCNLVAVLPQIAAEIYRNAFGKEAVEASEEGLDWSGRFAADLGFNSLQVRELLRLYLTIHSDHEGGNVSAHATHLIGSALSDPYLAYAAGLNGLAGPLHGLANQDFLNWLMQLTRELGEAPKKDQIAQYVEKTLAAGKVVPGFGHAVLRKTDPRYICQREFALKHLPEDPLFKIVSTLYEVVPEILGKQGKVKSMAQCRRT